ncbi:MAG TPA: ABC transporter permease [Anaerolineae bacterium]|nr:ABC transporter permease [Anaerolineae bacterium]
MLDQYFEEGLSLGLAQAAITLVAALAVALLARRWEIHLERETLVALVRGLVQVVAVGSILLLVFQGPGWLSVIVLAAMMLAAGGIAARRARGIPGAFWVSLQGIVFGAGTVILLMTWTGVIDSEMQALIPVGSMLIANSMNTGALALDRFRAEVEAHSGQIDAALALGADPAVTVAPYVQESVQAGLIPRVDTLRSLGIVWIPGIMAGMILSGSDPVYAAVYQFAVIAMIYAAAGLTAVATTLLIRFRAFSPAQQLILRPGHEAMAAGETGQVAQ